MTTGYAATLLNFELVLPVLMEGAISYHKVDHLAIALRTYQTLRSRGFDDDLTTFIKENKSEIIADIEYQFGIVLDYVKVNRPEETDSEKNQINSNKNIKSDADKLSKIVDNYAIRLGIDITAQQKAFTSELEELVGQVKL